MADLTIVSNAVATLLDTIPGLRVSGQFVSQVNPPAAIVMPQPGQSFRYDDLSGGISFLLRVVLLVAYTQDSSSVNLINSYLASTGSSSISAAFKANPRLSGACEYATMDAVRGYGLMDWAGQTYLGTQIPVTVMAT